MQPRFAIVAGHEHKAFIPYTGIWKDVPDPSIHAVVRAKVLDVQPNRVVLDRQWEGSTEIPFDFVTFATGTRLTAPGTMESDDKAPSIAYFQDYQAKVAAAKSIVIIGGGAVGVQMATDLRELHPDKKVTLVQSRDRLMPRFHSQFHDIIAERFSELGVDLVLNNRVVIPDGGFPEDGRTFNVQLKDGSEIETQLVIRATGQTPNNQLLAKLPASSPDSIINPDNGFIRVKPTMQFLDPQYPNMFAVGDIADTGAHKAARPGAGQAAVVAKNIAAIIAGLQPTDKIEINPAGIHMTLGMVSARATLLAWPRCRRLLTLYIGQEHCLPQPRSGGRC